MRKKIREWAESPRALVAGLSLGYVAVALALLPHFRYSINPDGISYISIARRYLAGDWHGAFNGYWSPLFSWLLVPFLALRIDPLLASKLLTILIGLVTIPGLYVLASRFALSACLLMIALVALLPALWRFTFFSLTPDFLIAGVLVWYFSVVFATGYPDRRRNAVLCGVLGALAYFAKAYGFYFFLAHFTLVSALLWLGEKNTVRRRAALRNGAIGLAVFAVLTGGWIAILSVKYGGPTVSTAGRFNHALFAPDAPVHPMHRGFLAPMDQSAISLWEDPSSASLPDWSATASAATMRHQARLIVLNLRDIVKVFHRYSVFAIAIVIAYLLFCLQARRRCLQPAGDAFPLLSLLLFPAGYALIVAEERYLYICLILLALMAARLLQWLTDRGFLIGRSQALASLLMALSIAVLPAFQTVRMYRHKPGFSIKKFSARLASLAQLQGNIATDRERIKTLHIAYHLGLRYFFEKGQTPDDEVLPTLARLGVRYYFVWHGSADDQARFQAYPEVTGGKIARLKIYQLPDPGAESVPSQPAGTTPRP